MLFRVLNRLCSARLLGCVISPQRHSSRFLDVLTAGQPEDIRWDNVRSKIESRIQTPLDGRRWNELRGLLQRYSDLRTDIASLRELIESPENEELKRLALEDLESSSAKSSQFSRQILEFLSSCSAVESDEVVMEITAGVGGQEAMLFAGTLFSMYENFVRDRGWNWEPVGRDVTELGGLRSGSSEICGPGAYATLKFEGGVHRVQRVPSTEKAGRMHTSTVSVVVLPVLPELHVNINQKDLKIDTMRSSGAGGQHVNRTESKVRLTHLPSGIVVECQEQRSQHQNKAKAMRVLSAKLLDLQQEGRVSQLSSSRKIQVGSRARSEKIRTYNYTQDRVTDHRISHSTHGLEEFLRRGDGLEDLVDRLRQEELSEKISELSELFADL